MTWNGIRCPACGNATGLRIAESRPGDGCVRRRRACRCGARFSTIEVRKTALQTLPMRRNAPTLDFDLFDGYSAQSYSAQYAEFADGSLAEVFLVPDGGPNGRVGMPLDTMAKDLSVLFSIARRYGAPVEKIRAALSQQTDGKMLGPLGEFLRLHAAERDA